MALSDLLKQPLLGFALLTVAAGLFAPIARTQDLTIPDLEKFRNNTPPPSTPPPSDSSSSPPSWVQVAEGNTSELIFVDDTTIAQESDPDLGQYVGFLSRLDIPPDNLSFHFVIGAHCDSRYYLVFQADIFDLQSGQLLDSFQYPEGTTTLVSDDGTSVPLPPANDGTLIAYAIDYACGNR